MEDGVTAIPQCSRVLRIRSSEEEPGTGAGAMGRRRWWVTYKAGGRAKGGGMDIDIQMTS